jgi:type VI secretion system protein VasD
MKFRVALMISLFLTLSGCNSLNKIGQVLMDPSIPVGAPKDQPTEVSFSFFARPDINGNPRSHDASSVGGVLEPSPYAINLSAGDPRALTEKVEALLQHLQEQFPAMSPIPQAATEPLARSPMEESSPGSYEDAAVYLTLPDLKPVSPEQIATPIAIKVLQLRDDSLLRTTVYQLLAQDPAKALRSTYVRDDDYVLLPGQFKFVPAEPLEADTRFIAVIANYNNQQNATWQQVLRIEPRGRKIALGVEISHTQILLKEES